MQSTSQELSMKGAHQQLTRFRADVDHAAAGTTSQNFKKLARRATKLFALRKKTP